MARNRLLVFARKPAPVQVTYLGYCGTTGLGAMDYRLSDPYLDPADADLDCYSERTLRLPRTYWCYQPGGPFPKVSSVPMEASGFVTFGCLNNFAKVSGQVLTAWMEILRRVPPGVAAFAAHAGGQLPQSAGLSFRIRGYHCGSNLICRHAILGAVPRHAATARCGARPVSLWRWHHDMRCALDGRACCHTSRRNSRWPWWFQHPLEHRPAGAGDRHVSRVYRYGNLSGR